MSEECLVLAINFIVGNTKHNLVEMDNLIVYSTSVEKIRIGNPNGDGGYIVCDLPGSYDLLLSGGIETDITFEKQFLSKYSGAHGFGFDGTIKGLPEDVPNLTFVGKNVGDVNLDKVTDMTEYFEGHSDIFLKLDIEGCEFQVVPNLMAKGLMGKVKQMVLEVHTPCDITRFPDYYAGFLQQYDNAHMFTMLKGLNKTHTLVHFHGNNSWHGYYPDQVIEGVTLPFVYELTFVRNDFVAARVFNTHPLPTPQDRQNSSLFPDWALSGWPYSQST